MKKICFLIAFTLTLALRSHGQKGLEAGAIILPQVYTLIPCESNPDKALKIPYSFGIGVDLGYNFTDRFGIRTGIIYSPIGEKYNDVTTSPELQVEVNLNYLQLPLYLKYNSSTDNLWSFLVLAGGYIGYLNEAQQSINGSDPIGVLSQYKRVIPGAALAMGTQINLDNGSNLNFLLRSSISLDTVETSGPSSRNFTLGLQLAYHYFMFQ